MNERPIPAAAQRDTASVEMLRVWVAEKQLHCSLKIGMYRDGMGVDEELAWGVILADAARHIARALHPENAAEESATLQKMLNRLNEELAAPTSDIKGGFV
ncbi:DUF5076 domain-containing protein [Duganella fentianensis]|uniref:DUF5076 domain-containing protein n=1 Tax=Duganella fentianensis TaxID=2692177 RepID=UPI0032B2BB51